jgi:hypothetical protein
LVESRLWTLDIVVLFGGGGQSNAVDAFLAFLNPTARTTSLPPGTGSYPVSIFYGPNIIPSSFQATLNGQPFLGFVPVAGTVQSVNVPLSPGRNLLRIQIGGLDSAGRAATDKDTLILIVQE